MLHEQFKPKTVKRKIATVKAFTHYLLIEDVIDINPFDKIEVSFKEPVILPRTIPSVSYTHLDVYKRQSYGNQNCFKQL